MHTEQIHLLTSSHAFAAPKCGKCWKDLFPSLLFGLLVPLSLVLHWLFTLRVDAGTVVVRAVTLLLVLNHHQQCLNSAYYHSCLNPLGPIFVHSILERAFSEDLQSCFTVFLHTAFQIPFVLSTQWLSFQYEEIRIQQPDPCCPELPCDLHPAECSISSDQKVTLTG